MVGYVTQMAGDDLRIGLRVGIIFPILLVAGLLIMKRCYSTKGELKR